jgi:hypothetical protein
VNGAIAVLKLIIPSTREPASAHFINYQLNAEPLLDIFKSRSENDANFSLSHLKKVNFIGCSGITVGRIGVRWLVHSSRLYIKPDLFGTGPHSLLVP